MHWPSTRPVWLPCASCVWKCSRAAGGGVAAAASPPPQAGAAGATSLSTSLEVSRDLFFFLPRRRSGMVRTPASCPTPRRLPGLCPCQPAPTHPSSVPAAR
uniref:Uncharacterized protein n=1 Tax=Pelusios castaneus TaxID=367368 RepID=A0A8C8RFX6_9SAUR